MSIENELKSFYNGRELPQSMHINACMQITDVALFVSLHLERMEHGCPMLHRIAISNLTALRNRLSPSELPPPAASSQHECDTEPNNHDRQVHAGYPAGP